MCDKQDSERKRWEAVDWVDDIWKAVQRVDLGTVMNL